MQRKPKSTDKHRKKKFSQLKTHVLEESWLYLNSHKQFVSVLKIQNINAFFKGMQWGFVVFVWLWSWADWGRPSKLTCVEMMMTIIIIMAPWARCRDTIKCFCGCSQHLSDYSCHGNSTMWQWQNYNQRQRASVEISNMMCFSKCKRGHDWLFVRSKISLFIAITGWPTEIVKNPAHQGLRKCVHRHSNHDPVEPTVPTKVWFCLNYTHIVLDVWLASGPQ